MPPVSRTTARAPAAGRAPARLFASASLLAGLLLLCGLAGARAQIAGPNDTARYLAGLPPSASSPLAAFAREPEWVRHASTLDQAWARIEKAQIAPIRAWVRQHIPAHRKLMLYMFSGPDFLYADAFFPKATTYVLSALEPVGPLPRVDNLSRAQRGTELQALRFAMQGVLSYSFFITAQMKSDLSTGTLTGTLPILYVFLARSGHTIEDVELVTLDRDGTVSTRTGPPRKGAEGVRIGFRSPDGESRTLYYFRTDLSNGGLAGSGLREFCATFGPADSLLKSASYLLHGGGFSLARDFLLQHSAVIVQDDSGIPLRHFDRSVMDLHPFGRYLGPIEVFPDRYQADMKRLFEKPPAPPVQFGIGYRWRTGETNVLLAIRRPATSAKVD